VISLIVATINRVTELDRLLSSLDAQTYKEFEVIVIDQNMDRRLVPMLQNHPALIVRHLRSERGVGKARNHGLRAATGDIIAFPDDDCWYSQSVLELIVKWLDQHRDFDAVFTTMRDADNHAVGPRWPPGPCAVTRANLWNTTICVTAFLRRAVTDAVGYFREDIGIGADSPYQSGEESDYFLRALAIGFKMRYEPGLTVHHPNLHTVERLRSKTYRYSLGCGCVLRLHGYSWVGFGRFLVRSIAGAVVSLCKGNIAMAEVYVMRAAGQLRGYFFGARELQRKS